MIVGDRVRKTVLIMAGGCGERFWPRSRKKMPKQFLSLTNDGRTMIQLTVERILPLVALEDVYIATNKEYMELVREQLPEIPKENILCEPVGRNTAPCIGLGAVHINKKYEDAIMMVLPSDHLIKHTGLFVNTLNVACEVAEQGEKIITLGIIPEYPETGYGYIKYVPKKSLGQAYQVEKFVEKPNLEKAKEYLETEEYFWNSGMFIWKVSTILGRMRNLMPETYAGLQIIKDAIGTEKECFVLEREFSRFESISVDYGILEKASDIYTIPGSFGWDDVGSWLAVSRIKKTNQDGNVVSGNVTAVHTTDCIIEGTDKLIATVGLKDLIVVDTQDAMLICNKNNANDIKLVLESLKRSNQEKYL